MPKITCLIGEIVDGFVRTEYLLSQIASELGFLKFRTELFSDPRTSKKFNEFISALEESQIERKDQYCSLISDFNKCCEDRNMAVHSLILTSVSDEDEYMFHNYLKTKTGVLNKSKIYTASDLTKIKMRIVDIHNKLWNLHFKRKI